MSTLTPELFQETAYMALIAAIIALSTSFIGVDLSTITNWGAFAATVASSVLSSVATIVVSKLGHFVVMDKAGPLQTKRANDKLNTM